MKYLKTPLRYPGGKSRVAKDFIPRFPNDIKEYREPFVGGASVALLFTQKYPDVPVWINDKYTYLYNFWVQLQKRGDDLSEALREYKIDHSSEDKAKELFKASKENIKTEEDDFERACLFWILNKCSYSGLTENSSFSATASRQNFTTRGASGLKFISSLIQDWKITNLDYSEVMSAPGDGTFIYLDPPYQIGVYLYGSNAELHKSFNHEEFVKACEDCKHDWFVTYNNSDTLKEAYSNFHQEEFKITYGMKHRPDNKMKKELLVCNYDINRTPLEALYGT
jgi:DNA adenine methylase